MSSTPLSDTPKQKAYYANTINISFQNFKYEFYHVTTKTRILRGKNEFLT